VEDISLIDTSTRKRMVELSRLAYQRGIVTYSDFLNLDQLHTLHNLPKSDLDTKFVTFGGYEGAERQMVAFYQDALCFDDKVDISNERLAKPLSTECINDIFNFPSIVISIQPSHIKYSGDLNHRDYLGAIIGLGIERSKIGDILVTTDFTYVFVHSSLAEYITDNLTQVGCISVTAKEVPLENFTYEPKFTEIKGSVSSLRLDAILSLALSGSRNQVTNLIQGGKVFVNGRLIISNSYKLKDGDIISVRRVGKYRFVNVISKTKKERDYVLLYKYS
jgi:RNA-binding protein YlmH